ncbi:MAG TPA: FAD-binding dehydrogenase [Anaeromyxobacteraceae bacterium]|nr:FAD-binding dehydrogenase [Anaeromyxobacteraceae bacterium]
MHSADAIVIGGGLSGLVAAHELTRAKKRVILIDQEGSQSLGGQAFWSLGGLFFVDSCEQRRMGIQDSYELALDDWMGSAGFDRDEDAWPRRWAEAYVQFAAGEKRAWLRRLGMRWFPVVGWAERGGCGFGHGNSVPRFHVTWGTGPAVLTPFVEFAKEAESQGCLTFLFRHRVDELIVTDGAVVGVRGKQLAPAMECRGVKTSRDETGDFEVRAGAVIVASGGIGANHELVRKNWPERLGPPPKAMVQGVPDYVDGRVLQIVETAGARVINRDRMWHYTEGLRNWNPVWTNHGIRILPGPSSIWLDANGRRLPPPFYPGFDTLGTLQYIMRSGHEHTWFVLNQSIVKREFALSGSEQNPDLTGKSWRLVLQRTFGRKAMRPVEAFKERGADFVVADDLQALVEGMNAKTPEPLLDFATVEREIVARDRQLAHDFGKDLQIAAIKQARNYRGDRLVRTAKLGRILDRSLGPLIAVKLNILTRKTLGGIETDLFGRALRADGQVFDGLFAAGEAAGFGGGGVHGYRALEGSFLGGCLFSGRAAGRGAAGST